MSRICLSTSFRDGLIFGLPLCRKSAKLKLSKPGRNPFRAKQGQSHLQSNLPFLFCMVSHVPVWVDLVQFEPFCVNLGYFQSHWVHQAILELFWGTLGHFLSCGWAPATILFPAIIFFSPPPPMWLKKVLPFLPVV